MLFTSLTTGAPAAITDFSAPVFGILGVIAFAIFAIGGKQDNDGQGTNSSPYLDAPAKTSETSSDATED